MKSKIWWIAREESLHKKRLKYIDGTQHSGWYDTSTQIFMRFSFSEFPIGLHEWLSKLEKQKISLQGGELTEWNPQSVKCLTSVRNLVSRDLDFWIDRILEGYITEFVVDAINSYSVKKRNFFHGPSGIYLSYLKTWIKNIVCEKGIV